MPEDETPTEIIIRQTRSLDGMVAARKLQDAITIYAELVHQFLSSPASSRTADVRNELTGKGEQLVNAASKRMDFAVCLESKLLADMILCDEIWGYSVRKNSPSAPYLLLGWSAALIIAGWVGSRELVAMIDTNPEWVGTPSYYSTFQWLGAIVCFLTVVIFVIFVRGLKLGIRVDDDLPTTNLYAPGKAAHRALLQRARSDHTPLADGVYSGRPVWIRFGTDLMNARIAENLNEVLSGNDHPTFSVVFKTDSVTKLRISSPGASFPRTPEWKVVPLPSHSMILFTGVSVESTDPVSVSRWLEENREAAAALAALFAECFIETVEINDQFVVSKAYSRARTAATTTNTFCILEYMSVVANSVERNSV